MSNRVLSPKQQSRLDSLSGFTTNLTPASVFEENLSYSAAADPVAASTGSIQPVLNIGTPNRYNPDGTAQVIAPNLSIADPDGGTLDAANVFISGTVNPTTESLGISGQTGNSGTIGTSINWTYNPTTGVLSFTGTATNLEYENALKSVTYNNSNAQEGQGRGIEFSLGRPIYYAPNGHYYEFVNNRGISWTNANNAANGRDYFGLQGYLATITDQGEQDFIQQRLAGNGWIGANDVETPDTWKWVTGPEAGTIFWSGGPKGQGGQAVEGRYENWRTLNDPEPNNSGGNESYAHMIGNDGIDKGQSRGKWNDLPDDRDYTTIPQFEPLGYIVEYGGFANETQPQTRGLANLVFGANNPLNFPDFNRDGTPDILWRNYNDGKNAVWTIKYNAANTTTPFTLGSDSKFITQVQDTGWSMEGVADYDNDGVLDILWRNYNEGKNAIWLMQNGSAGLELKNGYFITEVPDTAWEIEAAKDFNGDGKQNILWRNYDTGRNAIWTLDFNAANPNNPFSLNSAGTVFIDSAPDTNWEIAGWHDMTGDVIADIVWRNFSTGRNAVWGLRSTNGVPSIDNTKQYFVEDAPVGWELEEVVDFNGDGIGDFLWRNYGSGENAIWEMSSGGDIKQNGAYFVTPNVTPAADWEIEGVADFTGDGIGDILWRNYATDETAIWRMRRNQNDRIELDGGFFLNQRTSDTNWEIEAPSAGNRILTRSV